MEIRELYRQAESNDAPTAVVLVASIADENAIESRGRAAFDAKTDDYLDGWLGNVVDILSGSECPAEVVAWFAARGVVA